MGRELQGSVRNNLERGADATTAGRPGGAAGAREKAGAINRKKTKQQQMLTDVTL